MQPTTLFQYLQQQSKPVSISEILAAHPTLIRRTAQRWLNQLLTDGRVQTLGNGRSRKYIAKTAEQAHINTHKADKSSDHFPSYIPISPRQQGYHRLFISADLSQPPIRLPRRLPQ